MKQQIIKKIESGSQLGYQSGCSISSTVKRGSPANTGTKAGRENSTTPPARFGKNSRIAVYARVSTQNQEKENTVQSQLHSVREYALAEGGRIFEHNFFIDEGYSGSNLVRPGLDRLRDKVTAEEYDFVLVHDPDRLARNYVYQMLLLEEFEKSGSEIIFIRRPIGKTPDEQLLLQMQGVIAEYERMKICERTRRGRMHRMRNGELVTGRHTYGYKYISKTSDTPACYEIISEEAEVVRNIFKWYTTEKISIRQVAERLNSAGISSARGKKWRHSSIHNLLKNSMYAGTGYGHKVESVLPRERPLDAVYRKYQKTGKKPRPRDEWIPFSCPSIIDEETFELAMERLEHNKKVAARRTQKEYLLRGLIICSSCGRHMHAEGRTMKYICPYTNKQTAADLGVPICDNRTRFPVDELDTFVWEEIVKMLKKPTHLKKSYKRFSGNIVPKASGGHDALENKKAKLNEQIKRVNSLFIRGMIENTEHAEKHKMLKNKIHQIQLQLDKTHNDKFEEREIEQILSSFNRFSNIIKTKLNSTDFSTKRTIIEQLVKQVSISKKSVTIEYAAPLTKCSLRPTNH